MMQEPAVGRTGIGAGSQGVAIELDHVSKRYGASAAVEDLSLQLPPGRICVLVGPSGCGKTTTLKLINRLISPSDGRVLIDGRDIAGEDPTTLRRSIGYVIQQVGLFPHLTVGQNVATVPRLLGWPADRIAERTEVLLTLVGLDPAVHRDRYPAQLSGGERQRVGVARALAADPPLMLMDEPFGAVDPIVRGRLQDEFLRLQANLAKTIVFVTHDIDEAIKVGDLVAVLESGGRLAQLGSPAELLAAPASPFVARFVGADRAIKRLALHRVGELELLPAVTARLGDEPAPPRSRVDGSPVGELLLVDSSNRPIGWLAAEVLDGEVQARSAARRAAPAVGRDTSLRDALASLLDADVPAAAVVDGVGAVIGLVTVEMIVARMRVGLANEAGSGPLPATTAPATTAPAPAASARAVSGQAASARTVSRAEGPASGDGGQPLA